MQGLRDALRKLPETLEESYAIVYQQMMDCDENAKLIAVHAINWLLCAKRQLSSQEFLAAVTISCYGEQGGQSDNPLNTEEVLDICCNLIVLDKTVDMFRVAHLSVREYFEKRDEYGVPQLHTRALGACLDTLLAMPDLSFCTKLFYTCASACWAFHCAELGDRRPEGVTGDKINEFLYNQQYFLNWASNLQHSSSGFQENQVMMLEDARDVSSAAVSPLFAACVFGFLWIMQDLEKRPDFAWDFVSDNGDSGLLLASKWGHIDIMRFLINKGVDVAATQNLLSSETPLYFAIKNRHLESVLILLENGALVGARCWGMSNVKHAANCGHGGILEAVLSYSRYTLKEWEASDLQIDKLDGLTDKLNEEIDWGFLGMGDLFPEKKEIDGSGTGARMMDGDTLLEWLLLP